MKGMVIFAEDIKVLKAVLGVEALDVICALSEYANNETPETDSFSQAQMLAFLLLKQKIDMSKDKYDPERRKLAGKKAAEARWGKKEVNISSENKTPKNTKKTQKNDISEKVQEINHYGEVDLEELQKEQAVQDDAEQLCKQYGLPYNSHTLDEMAKDVREHGREKVEEALKKASESDVKGGVSLNFYRAILQNTGQRTKKSPHGYTERNIADKVESAKVAVVNLFD